MDRNGLWNMETRAQKYIKQIDGLLAKFPSVKRDWHPSTFEGFFKDTTSYEALITESYSLLAHIYGKNHPHVQRTVSAINEASLHSLEQIEGILEGTRSNLEAGLLEDLTSKILMDLKADFLSTSQQLMEEGQKDPAAVLACVVLEDSLKRLAAKHRIDSLSDKEMSVVAGSLLAKGIIEKTTNQSIQSFKALRNAALHAQWSEVSVESLKLLLVFLPPFIEKHGL